MNLHLSLSLPEDVTHLPLLRRVSRDVLRSCRVDDQDVDDIELLVGELATNAVRHAQSFPFRVDIELRAAHAIITVSDSGPGFVRGAVPPPGTLRPDGQGTERVGGWGLPLVELLADQVEFLPGDPHGTIVRAVKMLHMHPESAA